MIGASRSSTTARESTKECEYCNNSKQWILQWVYVSASLSPPRAFTVNELLLVALEDYSYKTVK